MRHHIFTPSSTGYYRGAILIKATSFTKDSLVKHYVHPLADKGISDDSLLAFTLTYDDAKKVSNKTMKAYLAELLPELDQLQVTTLYVADSNYFKVLAGQTKADVHMGYALPCKIKGFEHMTVCLGVNYAALVYNPELASKITLSLGAFAGVLNGTYKSIGNDIIHSAQYPQTVQDIAQALQRLHAYPELTCDIETFSLRFNEAGIGTIAFAWDEHNGIAFACDYYNSYQGLSHQDPSWPGSNIPNKDVRFLLKSFFSQYQGTITWHNGAFDLKPIIYNLWMESLADTRGLLTGLDTMYRGFEDTKIVAYLALNSTADYSLGLKSLAHEFAGNYAQDDIKDIRRIPLGKLLEYNLVDCLSTWYVKKKLTPKMVADQQEELYRSLLLPSQKLLTQMELTGMAMSKAKLEEVEAKLQKISQDNLAILKDSPVIKTMNLLVQTKKMEDKNAVLKKKQVTLDDFADELFNPRSGQQLQRLLYECMGLPVIDRTATGQPGTGNDTLKKLLNHAQQPEYKTIIKAIMGFLEAEKILTTFIPAFKKGLTKADDGIIWLFGSFNIGGTVSGRLSSSDPNLQNIPANSTFGKLIKEIFTAPKGWLFCGADFNSLEDYISALTTKDPNKLRVYEQGFDGHALRACSYFPEELGYIDINDPKQVNKLKEKDHPHGYLRQESKAPTFLLTYNGTHHGMMSNLGWTLEKSMKVEAAYHDLYKVSDEYVQGRLKQASKDGYVTVAFGLRVRTPLLAQCLWDSNTMPHEAKAEGRTAANALGQSFGLLNNRAAVDFWNKVWASPYRYEILPCALIHDSIYMVVCDRPDVMEWANRELIKSMSWQELPEIEHPTVRLGANLGVFWPNWSNEITLPNNASVEEIITICRKGKQKYVEKMQEVRAA